MKFISYFLLALGLLQMLGDVSRIQMLKAIGAATMASPLPKVFTSVQGLETFSSKFFLEWEDKEGHWVSIPIDSNFYSKLQGPYNRRNVYGAVIAYAPVLPNALRDPVLEYAFCHDAPILVELGIDPYKISGKIRIRLEPVTEINNINTIIDVPCT